MPQSNASAFVPGFKRWVSDHLIALAFYLSVIGIIGVGLMAYYVMARMVQSEAWETHTEQAISKIEQLLQSVVSAESAGRAFLVTGEPSFREDYEQILNSVDIQLHDFKEFTVDNAFQREATDRLNQNISRRFAFLSGMLGVRAKQGFLALQQVNLGTGVKEMHTIRATIEQIRNEEMRLLAMRTGVRKDQNDLLRTILTILMLSGVVIMGLVFRHMNRLWLARKKAEMTAVHLAHHDPLTGLPNRRMLADRMTGAIARAARYNETFAVLCLDLDGFKGINDAHGHECGDELLNQASARIQTSLRAIDTVARVGGDEFVVVLLDIKKIDYACVVADKLLACVANPYTVGGRIAIVGTSIGIGIYPLHGSTPEELLRRADMALYAAKFAGKHRYAVASEDSLDGKANPPSAPRMTHPRLRAVVHRG